MVKLRTSLLFLMLLSALQSHAVLSLSAYEDVVCGKMSIVLENTGNPDHFYRYYVRYKESDAWKQEGDAPYQGNIYANAMPSDVEQVFYKIQDEQTLEFSNVVTITRNTSLDCAKTCHESSTGNFFQGTDFNPETGVETDKPAIPLEVVDYFDENKIVFKHEESGSDYKVVKDLSSIYGDKVPYLDSKSGNDNYYYVYEKNPRSSTPFSYSFPCGYHAGKTYRFTMRFYVLKENPDCDNRATIKLETKHGNQTSDRAIVYIYDDATNTLLKKLEVNTTFGETQLELKGPEYDNKLIRVEANYYGTFPMDDRYNAAAGTWNGMAYFVLTPFFQQFDGCFKVAIDYISAEIESICLSPDLVCVGEAATVNAAGFSPETEFKWEVASGIDSNKQPIGWEPLYIDGQLMEGVGLGTIDIPVNKVGITYYRLNGREDLTFRLVGKACDPPGPSSIKGNEQICYPNTEAITYTPYPATTNEKEYSYAWVLKDPNGTVINDKNVIYFANPAVTGQVSIKIPDNYPEGDYKLTVTLNKKVLNKLEQIGDSYTATIPVWHRPSAEFLVEGGSDEVCPYEANVKFEANDKATTTHTYVWTNAQAQDDTKPYLANIQMPANYCEAETVSAKLKVYVNAYEQCYDEKSKDFGLNKSQPVIDCDKLGGDTSIYVSASATDTTIILPKPEISATCDANPTVVITIKGKAADGSNIDQTLTIKKEDFSDETFKATIPVTAGKIGGEKGDNGVTVTYVVKDACAITSEPCSFSVYIRDTFPPVVDCETMPYYVVNDSLAKYPSEACVATPGGGGNLPVLTAPSLEDKLHPGTYITGTFEGRFFNGELEAAELNDPYKVGTTIIRWKFYDSARNSDSCFQTINVVDNKDPKVKCPNVGELSVQPKGADCHVTAEGLIEQINEQLGADVPTATDICQPDVTLVPRYYYREVGKTEWNELTSASDIKFEIKKDDMRLHYEFQYRFYKPAGVGIDPNVYVSCEVAFKVVDNKKPEFDCDTIPNPMIWNAESGKCAAASKDILKNWKPWPYALEACTRDSIAGELVMADGSAWPDSIPVGQYIKVRWIFKSEQTSEVTTCDKDLLVKSDKEPVFDCEQLLKDTIFINSVPGECYGMVNPVDIPQQIAKDACTGDNVFGVATRKDGGELYGRYELGGTVLVWTFISPYSNTPKICEQIVWVKTDKTMDGGCNNEADRLKNYPDIHVSVSDGSCATKPANVLNQLTDHFAAHPCYSDIVYKGVPSRSDGKAMDADYPVDTIKIFWTFTDTTNTLLTPESVCEQVVMISNDNAPVVKCEEAYPDTTIYLDIDNCFADLSMIKTYLEEIPTNPCNGEKAKVDTTRQSGKKMNQPFEIGTDVIYWTFTFPSTGAHSTCVQNIEVLDTVAPYFDCSSLPSVINVELREGTDKFVPYSMVVEKGFKIPVATDKCSEVTVVARRSDGKAIEDNYPLGPTEVTFTFSDKYGNSMDCHQTIEVFDQIPPIPDCPKYKTIASCLTDIPAPFETYDEFIAAGGSVNEPGKVIKESFTHEDIIIGDSCNSIVVRDYKFTTTTEVVVGCSSPDTFTVIDNVKPVIEGVKSNGEHFVTTCDQLDTVPPVATVSDNCDPNPKLTMTRVSTQDPDPSKCGHYTYKVTYTWTAVDRCGNEATPIKYEYDVVDTVPPEIHVPADWKNVIHPDYLGNCLFGIPSVVDAIPKDSIFQNCGDNEFLTFTQKPAAGTIVDKDTVIILTISDVCHNPYDLTKKVKVQSREDIVSLDVDPITYVCGDDASLASPRSASNSLSSIDVHVSGVIWEVDFDGSSWIRKNTSVVWDYYRSKLDGNHIQYSNNPTTYADKFADADNNDEAFGKYNLLLRENYSDTYFFVAYDTVSGCSDSVDTYIVVRERPRISLSSAPYSVCEGDSLELSGDFLNANPVCVEDKGAPITAEGWMVNGVRYDTLSSINIANGTVQSAVYYATNECGTSTSTNTLKASCFGSPVNSKDSLTEVGSLENLKLWREDKLYTSDSITLNVYTHFTDGQVLLTTQPQDKPRVWEGDDAHLLLTTPYQPSYISWKRVEGEYDAEGVAVYDRYGNIVSGGSGENNDVDLEEEYYERHPEKRDTSSITTTYTQNYKVRHPADSAYYYVVVGNGVCPTVSSNVVNIDVMKLLPTAITPYDRDGMNDVFMPGHHVIIFNRYGSNVFEGNNGWDGTFRGVMADPGVYYYTVDMKYGPVKGSVEVVKIR